ncbi:SDR family oxidoreductase [Paenibacillus pinisoli]|uniref:SDR family oxidoreductase n=1 Tax=Paenibacillus pinisoli TaxID=1276110 RepID=A0A3A6PXX5_9BACL|nr:SDR family oxidoreductase [Paenibacillus pinisoli]RJX40213.1 SDR family oxidoreductase [Paenibacillus pinisoli]
MKHFLAGKRVVIIGGSSGIGLAAAKAACEQGASVHIAARSRNKLLDAIQAIGGDVTAHEVNAAYEDEMKALFDSMDLVDHVFVTASEVATGAVLESDSEQLRSSLDSRFWGCYFAAKYASPKMHRGGSITFMSGTSSVRPSIGSAVAAASGAAVESLARTLALELAPIRVNTISAGAIDTPLLDNIFGEKKAAVLAHLTEQLPVKRMGQPEDIADAALFLMNNSYTTGTVLTVDGGMLVT